MLEVLKLEDNFIPYIFVESSVRIVVDLCKFQTKKLFIDNFIYLILKGNISIVREKYVSFGFSFNAGIIIKIL